MERKMSELQQRLLDMMVWFDTYCSENNLRYYIMGGTLLGAMRHGGFIPWDDDLDIGMPRKDYNRLKEIYNNEGRFELEMPDSLAKDFCYGHAKLFDTTTTLIENRRIEVKRGLYIDIFPIDGIGNDMNTAKKNYRSIKLLNGLLVARTAAIRKGRSKFKNALALFFRIIPESLFPTRNLRLKLDRLMSKHDFDQSSYVGNLLGLKLDGEIVPKEYFGIPQNVKFENAVLKMQAQPKKYLEHIYGNWEKLPPKEKQVTHHDFIMCDLNTPYKCKSK